MTYLVNVRLIKLENMIPTTNPAILISLPEADFYYNNEYEYNEKIIEIDEGIQIPFTDLENQGLEIAIGSIEDDFIPKSPTMSISMNEFTVDSKPELAKLEAPTEEFDGVLCTLYMEISIWSEGPKIPVRMEVSQLNFKKAVECEARVYENKEDIFLLDESGCSYDFEPMDTRSSIEIIFRDIMTKDCFKECISLSSIIDNPDKQVNFEKNFDDDSELAGNIQIKLSIPSGDNDNANEEPKKLESENNDKMPPEILQMLLNPMLNPMINMIPPDQREQFLNIYWSQQPEQYKLLMSQMIQMQRNPMPQMQQNTMPQFQPNPFVQFQSIPFAQFQQLFQIAATNQQPINQINVPQAPNGSNHIKKGNKYDNKGSDDDNDDDYNERSDDDSSDDDFDKYKTKNLKTSSEQGNSKLCSVPGCKKSKSQNQTIV